MWKFSFGGDYGCLYGLFKATYRQVFEIMGREVYFGEVFGKHSEVYGEIEDDDITFITDDKYIVDNMIEFGYNPIRQ